MFTQIFGFDHFSRSAKMMLDRNKRQPLFGCSSCEIHVGSTEIDFNPQVMLGKSRRRSPPDTKLQFFADCSWRDVGSVELSLTVKPSKLTERTTTASSRSSRELPKLASSIHSITTGAQTALRQIPSREEAIKSSCHFPIIRWVSPYSMATLPNRLKRYRWD
jgi:hypothetical protein